MSASTVRGVFAACMLSLLAACSDSGSEGSAAPKAGVERPASAPESEANSAEATADMAPEDAGLARLEAVLGAQPEEVQARYRWRHPRETLRFFDVEPGMRVIEVLPAGGWYTKILVPYLGAGGTLIGVDYAPSMLPLFGFYSEEALKAKETWPTDWVRDVEAWAGDEAPALAAFQFGSVPADMEGTVDTVLFIRALHNLARFEGQGGFLTQAIDNAFTALKPGGIAGVVQHQAPEEASDSWASGDNGYLKKSFVIDSFEAAGFEYLGNSAINENPADQPTEEDKVWRLPPGLMMSRGDDEATAAYEAIGESNRMTLKFRKPA